MIDSEKGTYKEWNCIRWKDFKFIEPFLVTILMNNGILSKNNGCT